MGWFKKQKAGHPTEEYLPEDDASVIEAEEAEEAENNAAPVVEGRVFDRLVQFDPRSRNFSIRTAIGTKAFRGYTWRCDTYNDQGREGACVGFSWSHELSARPVKVPTDDNLALKIYRRARQLDAWEGEDYDGTSIIAGAKATQELGYIEEYRWAFGLEDVILAIGYAGPVVFGLNWYEGMFQPDEDGFLRVSGRLAGGHAIMGKAVKLFWYDKKGPRDLSNLDLDKSYIVLHNSWGPEWGVDGTAKISLSDLRRLLAEDGEACIPLKRKK